MNPEAYDLYLRGLSHTLRDDEQDIDQAITLLEKSAALDPAFVPALAYLAASYGRKASIYRPNDPQWEEKGFAAAQKALKLDADAPEAHYAQAVLLWMPSHRFQSREALQELRKALSAQPNFDEAWHQHAVILLHVGHLDAALRDLQRTLEINPGNTLARFRLGPIYVYQQKFEDAIAALDRVPREAFPAQWTYQRAWALISLGRFEEAGGLLDAALKENPVDQGGVIHAARAMLRAKRGDRTGAEADVAEAIRVGRTFIHFHHTAYAIGAVYATLGEFDKAKSGSRMRPTTDSPITPTSNRMCTWNACGRFHAFAHFSQTCAWNGSTFPANLSDPDPPARGPYFTTCSVTSILSVSPLILSVPVPNRTVWPSRITTVLLVLKVRNAAGSEFFSDFASASGE